MLRKLIKFAKQSALVTVIIFLTLCLYRQLHGRRERVRTLSDANKQIFYEEDQTELEIDEEEFRKEDMVDEHGNPYTIIIWTGEKGAANYYANPSICLANISCHITYDQRLYDVAHSIVFKADILGLIPMPKRRKPYQLYTWWTLESPPHTSNWPSSMDGIFNLTYHYRTDADVYGPYGSLQLILRELRESRAPNLDRLLELKRESNKMAVWAVSNCYLKRYLYGKTLALAGLKMDSYGLCFGRELGKGRYSKSFYDAISKYKFYLAFENSIGCKDYFTEKFWYNSLRSGSVPVVWGPKKEDLLKVAPTKSFIHADDFSGPMALVRYLNYLAKNETAYAEYLQWRTWVEHPERIELRLRKKTDIRGFCKLCSIVQSDGRRRKKGYPAPKRVIPSLKDAWLGPEKGCHA